MIDKVKVRNHAVNMRGILERDRSPARMKQIVTLVDSTREHMDVWHEELGVIPGLMEEITQELKARPGQKRYIMG
jgi:hypothetical protein